MKTSKITPLSADAVIAGVEKKGGRRLSGNIRIMIRLLSAKALFPDELVEKLRNNPDYNCRGADDKFIKLRLQTLRHHKILSRLGGCYFIKGAMADPEIQDSMRAKKPRLNQPNGKTEKSRSLRSIIYELLLEEPLPLNWLAIRTENHPDYDGRYKGKKLRQVVNWLLNEKENRERFFERESERKKFSVWRLKANSSPPPKGFHRYSPPRQNELYRIMRTKSVINGWLYLDLCEEVSRPDSGYCIKPGSSKKLVVAALGQVLKRGSKEGYFESIPAEGKLKRWRAKWQGLPRVPSRPGDFKDLAIKIMDDLIFPLSLDNLLQAVRQHGHLFGYIVNELPGPFLRNSIVRVIAGTKHAERIRS